MARKSASPSTSRRCTLLVLLVAAAALSVATLSATPVAAQPIFPRPRQGPLHRLFGGGNDAEETTTPVAAPAPWKSRRPRASLPFFSYRTAAMPDDPFDHDPRRLSVSDDPVQQRKAAALDSIRAERRALGVFAVMEIA